MRLYLAELFHLAPGVQNPHTRPCTVPLGIGFLASTVRRRFPDVDVRLFRNPDELLQSIDVAPPDMLGLGVCIWNRDLSRRVASRAKHRSPRMSIVVGGPLVDDTDEQITDLLRGFEAVDYAVPGEGEHGLCELLRHIVSGGGRDGPVIDGVAYLRPNSSLIRGRYVMPKANGDVALDDLIPSPYLDGSLDPFLDAGMVPIVQTMRGCPYSCGFCVSGTSLWSKARAFALDRVKAEIEYALERSGHDDLILTDENWGILGERDVELARYIRERHRRTARPKRLYYYTAKVVNDASRAIVEMVAPLAWLDEFTMSYQTVNPESRKAIKRVNIPLDKVAWNVAWANERGISTGSEMIFGFPHETLTTFIDGIETLLRVGIHKVNVLLLLLFPGIDLNSRASREANGVTTRFRVTDSWYGAYANGDLVAVEAEELVVSTRWTTLDDYMHVRRYQFFAYSMLKNELLLELMQLCAALGARTEGIIRHLVFADYRGRPGLASILDEHERGARTELKETADEVYEEVADRIRAGALIELQRPNVLALARILNSGAAVAELVGLAEEFVDRVLDGRPGRAVALTYVREVLPHRIVVLPSWKDQPARFQTTFDYARWRRRDFDEPQELLLDAPRWFDTRVHASWLRNLEALDTTTPIQLQKVIDGVLPHELLRSVR